jgi:hypothetical protein
MSLLENSLWPQTFFSDWGIQVDSIKQQYALQLSAFDGKLLAPLYQVANPPNMLPTVILTGVNVRHGRAPG